MNKLYTKFEECCIYGEWVKLANMYKEGYNISKEKINQGLYLACVSPNSNIATVRVLLKTYKANIHYKNDECLISSFLNKSFRVFVLLLRNGANLNCRDNKVLKLLGPKISHIENLYEIEKLIGVCYRYNKDYTIDFTDIVNSIKMSCVLFTDDKILELKKHVEKLKFLWDMKGYSYRYGKL